ncbi:MAG: hypothetical protein BRD46_03210 [Bacteroidetes bacterium QS_8_68_15]|nr:MAG: hypothetical protein BRD46_03210 [Bacteroidetes bacterium QS_8_68_15]
MRVRRRRLLYRAFALGAWRGALGVSHPHCRFRLRRSFPASLCQDTGVAPTSRPVDATTRPRRRPRRIRRGRRFPPRSGRPPIAARRSARAACRRPTARDRSP